MKRNLGSTDKVIRYILAIVAILITLLSNVSGLTQAILIAFAVIFIGTSLLSFCPLYAIVGLKTCKNEH
jgi:cellulose synthase/poly-beta-1,6-N-acetylglucosamine synthase-like glycosyltransferase